MVRCCNEMNDAPKAKQTNECEEAVLEPMLVREKRVGALEADRGDPPHHVSQWVHLMPSPGGAGPGGAGPGGAACRGQVMIIMLMIMRYTLLH